jgi:hypothetical protein
VNDARAILAAGVFATVMGSVDARAQGDPMTAAPPPSDRAATAPLRALSFRVGSGDRTVDVDLARLTREAAPSMFGREAAPWATWPVLPAGGWLLVVRVPW